MLLKDGRTFRTSQVIQGKILPNFLRVKQLKPPLVGEISLSLVTTTQPIEGLIPTSADIEIISKDKLIPREVPPASTPIANSPVLTPTGIPLTLSLSVTSLSITIGNTPELPRGALANHPELQYRKLSEDPLALLTSIVRELYEPKSYDKAVLDNNPNSNNQEDTIKDEINLLIENRIQELVNYLSDRKPLRGKWVFTLKRGPKGEVTRYKARQVVLRYSQREGLDYNKTFASVIKPISYKALFALVAALDQDLE